MRHPAATTGPLAGAFASVCLLLGAGLLWTSSAEPAVGLEGMELGALGVAVFVVAAGTIPVVALVTGGATRHF